ncbi:MAG TPA: DNA repair protein RecN [Polyangia bacterium]|jgi:DNA repair protein RecN (Recombination protein N)|nr:DNA repair protein RecN [Polyangia bacterium]
MLTHLHISGFALIDEVDLTLGPGMTVITGETGAGKSILVDAMGLLRGARAGVDVIRTGRDEARVEAIIALPPGNPARAALEADGRADLDVDVDDGLVVRRVITRQGRGRAHLGGGLATAGDLAKHVAGLIDVASQHDQQSLTDPGSQLAILDAFAENDDARAEMAESYAALVEARGALEAFSADARGRAEREDLLRFQLGELDAARPVAGEDEEMRVEVQRLKGAERFFGVASRGEDVLYASDGAVAERLASVAHELAPLADMDPALAPLYERLESARVVVEDVARDLGRYARGIKSDPARLAEIEERLHLLQRLCRKHGGTVADLAAKREVLARELGDLGSFDEALAARKEAAEKAETRARVAAQALSDSRRKAAAGLEKKIAATLRELGFSTPRVYMSIESRELGAAGSDQVRFDFAPNPGDPPRPLAKIASGGELSRVMLAVKQALARRDRVLTYVFDEVDAGIGGGTAETVGRKLKKIAGDRQVIVITHLPQVAAFADAHVRVVKTAERGKTRVTIEALDETERASELARMLAGANPSAEAKAHAAEMLRRARAPEPAPKARGAALADGAA